VYYPCCLKWLGFVLSTASTEPFGGFFTVTVVVILGFSSCATAVTLSGRRWGDDDARLSFLGSSGFGSDLSARSVVGLGAKMLALAPVLGV